MKDADFNDDDFDRLRTLVKRDPKLVDLIIHVTGGCSLAEAGMRMMAHGEAEIAQGRTALELAGLRAA